MSRYVLDRGLNRAPTGLAPHPYPQQQVGWPAQLLERSSSGTYVAPGSTLTHLGEDQAEAAPADNSKLISALVLIAAAFILWKVITPTIKRNPGKQRKHRARILPDGDGWCYKLVRKGSVRHGGYETRKAAVNAARRAGHKVA